MGGAIVVVVVVVLSVHLMGSVIEKCRTRGIESVLNTLPVICLVIL